MCMFFCFPLFLIGCIKFNAAALIASGLFGIGYAIEVLAVKLSKKE